MGRPATVGELGEEGTIRLIAEACGIDPASLFADDCALLESPAPILSTVDSLVEGVHFRMPGIRPESLGGKAFAVNASDIAASGGSPTAMLLSLSLPGATPVPLLQAFAGGLAAAAAPHSVRLLGGDTTAAGLIFISLTMFGELPGRRVRRDGARPGHSLLLTGFPGRARAGLAILESGDVDAARRFPSLVGALNEPQARCQAGPAAAKAGATAMIDISDGPLVDLRRLCRASGCGAELDATSIPLDEELLCWCAEDLREPLPFILSGGEDYELFITCPAACEEAVIDSLHRIGTPCSRVGCIVDGDAVTVPGHERVLEEVEPFGQFA